MSASLPIPRRVTATARTNIHAHGRVKALREVEVASYDPDVLNVAWVGLDPQLDHFGDEAPV
eukprot:6203852-Pleurochrysis_carterae.AAC.2